MSRLACWRIGFVILGFVLVWCGVCRLVLLSGGLGDLGGELWVLVCCGCYNMDFGRGLGLRWAWG